MWNSLERGALRYAFQQYNDAVRCLARGNETLRDRLERAWSYSLTHVRTENLPAAIRKKAEDIHRWMQRLHDPNFKEDADPGLVDDIVSVYTQITQELARDPIES